MRHEDDMLLNERARAAIRRGREVPWDELVRFVACTGADVPPSYAPKRPGERLKGAQLHIAQQTGCVLPWEPFELVFAQLSAANDTRRVRLLQRADVVECMVDALRGGGAPGSPQGAAYDHGGRVVNSYRGYAMTTLVLAYASAKRVTVGVVETEAHHASPGRAWPSLQPWREHAMWRRKCATWASRTSATDRVAFSVERLRDDA